MLRKWRSSSRGHTRVGQMDVPGDAAANTVSVSECSSVSKLMKSIPTLPAPASAQSHVENANRRTARSKSPRCSLHAPLRTHHSCSPRGQTSHVHRTLLPYVPEEPTVSAPACASVSQRAIRDTYVRVRVRVWCRAGARRARRHAVHCALRVYAPSAATVTTMDSQSAARTLS